MAQHAAFFLAGGVDALAAIPPIYFKLPEYSIEQYWKAMIDAIDLGFLSSTTYRTTGYALSMDYLRKCWLMTKRVELRIFDAGPDIERF